MPPPPRSRERWRSRAKSGSRATPVDLSETTSSTVVAAPATSAPLALPAENAGAEVLVELSTAQAAAPLVFAFTRDGLALRSTDDNGETIAVEVTFVQDNALFLDRGNGQFSGSDTGKRTTFTGRIKRIKIRRKRVGGRSSLSSSGEGSEDDVTYQIIRYTVSSAVARRRQMTCGHARRRELKPITAPGAPES